MRPVEPAGQVGQQPGRLLRGEARDDLPLSLHSQPTEELDSPTRRHACLAPDPSGRSSTPKATLHPGCHLAHRSPTWTSPPSVRRPGTRAIEWLTAIAVNLSPLPPPRSGEGEPVPPTAGFVAE